MAVVLRMMLWGKGASESTGELIKNALLARINGEVICNLSGAAQQVPSVVPHYFFTDRIVI